jgi:hypothetical protein
VPTPHFEHVIIPSTLAPKNDISKKYKVSGQEKEWQFSESYSTNHFGNPKMMYKLKHFYANAFVAELNSVRVKPFFHQSVHKNFCLTHTPEDVYFSNCLIFSHMDI